MTRDLVANALLGRAWYVRVRVVPKFGFFTNYLKFAHDDSVQDGSDAFPNELVRFRFEATPIWEKIQTHCKNAVII